MTECLGILTSFSFIFCTFFVAFFMLRLSNPITASSLRGTTSGPSVRSVLHLENPRRFCDFSATAPWRSFTIRMYQRMRQKHLMILMDETVIPSRSLQGIHISHLGERRIIFESAFGMGYVCSQEGYLLQYWDHFIRLRLDEKLTLSQLLLNQNPWQRTTNSIHFLQMLL